MWRRVAIAAPIVVYAGFHREDCEFAFYATRRSLCSAVALSALIADYKLNSESNDRHALHQRGANWLLWLAERNKGIFIKVGQHLSALTYILPREYTATLSVLQDQCVPTGVSEIDGLFVDDVGKPLDAFFTEFEEKPLGVASMAQVHKARLKNGDAVAIKVQHPSLDFYSAIDLKTCRFFVRVAKRIFDDFEFEWLAREMETNLPKELDFRFEHANINKMEKLGFVKVPRVYWATKRIIVMEFIDGKRVDDRAYLEKHGIDRRSVLFELTKVFSRMVFDNGFVHIDPHSGNILIRAKPQSFAQKMYNRALLIMDPLIWVLQPYFKLNVLKPSNNFDLVLLDHGMYRTLQSDFQQNYAHLWINLLLNKSVKEQLERFGINSHDAALFQKILTGNQTISRSITRSSWRASLGASEEQILAGIIRLLGQIPPDLVMVFKTNDLIRLVQNSLVGDDWPLYCKVKRDELEVMAWFSFTRWFSGFWLPSWLTLKAGLWWFFR